jgi:predicted nucleic acid-binding protein
LFFTGFKQIRQYFPKINVRELDEDLDQFARRLRIKEYFHSKKETSEDLSTDESDIKEVIDINMSFYP